MIDEYINKRISRIIEIVQKAGDGDFSLQIETTGTNDEIDKLSGVLNRMFKKISGYVPGGKEPHESALKHINEKYRRLKANIPGMIFLFAKHPDGTFSFPYVNEASQELFDISPNDLMRDSTLIINIIHPEDRERFELSVKQSAETLLPWREVLRHIVNGEVRWYDCMSRPELQSNGDILWDGIILEITDYMKIVELLKASEQRLSDIIASSPVGIAIYDSTGQCIAANDSLARIIGEKNQQVLAQNYNSIELWKKSDLLKISKEVIKEQTPKRHEVVAASANCKEIFLDCHLVPFDRNGLLFITQDITERKRTEMNLRQRDLFLNNIIDQNPYAIWISDDKGTLIRINQACLDLLDIRKEEVIGKYNVLKDNIVIEQGYLPLVQSVFSQGITVNFTLEYNSEQLNQIERKQRTNVILEITIAPVKDESNKITNAIIMHRNITEIKNAEASLRQAKAYVEKLIESANAMIVVLNDKGEIQVFNKAAEEITGYTRQEVLGYNWFEIVVPREKYPEVWVAFQSSVKKKFFSSYENPILTKTGEERFISFRNTELLQNNIFIGSLFYGIDITDRKQLEEQLLQSQKMEAVGQLAGGIAHDFNNMLSVILGHAELIKSSLPMDHPVVKNALEIEKAGFHSRNITRQLLAFSRKQIIAPKSININKIITHITKTLSQLISENINLRTILDKDLWNIRFDPSQIDQILINLAVNSRDAMPDGGSLIIETSNIFIDEAYCSLHVDFRPGEFVLLQVTDNGIGMDKELLSHIFEPFFTTKKVGKGTGLGLATVYGIIKQNGGFINIYSEPKQGTIFKIYIPRLKDESVREELIKETTLFHHSGNILLVEDDDMVRKMIVFILEKIGYTVIAASTPMGALEICENDTTVFSLLITDVVMPEMTGTELSNRIKKIRPDIKILYMSGYTEDVIIHHGILKEGIHFVQKPFGMKDFAKKVRDAIESK